jgi:hypothetical protein
MTEITVRDGFLLLSSYARPGTIEYVKGSAIIRISSEEIREEKPRTIVTIGPWSIEVTETSDVILEAIARSYKQAGRR